MYKKQQEIVPVQLVNASPADTTTKKTTSAKLALRLKNSDGQEVFVYNGINNYILQTLLKEWQHHVS